MTDGGSLPSDHAQRSANDPEGLVAPIRRVAASRRFAVATWHPDAERVDGETWWLAFREGAHWAIESSSRISLPLQWAAQMVLLLGQRRCPHCGKRLDEEREADDLDAELNRGSAYWRSDR